MTSARRPVVITGASGFIGQNLTRRLSETDRYLPVPVTRAMPLDDISSLGSAIAVVHLAGANRPENETGFDLDNVQFTSMLCRKLSERGATAPILYASSIQAGEGSMYGRSKLAAETALLDHARQNQSLVSIYRLPNVFGKWSRPNYNSAVATFCFNVARRLPIRINDPLTPLTLVYVDDVIDHLIAELDQPATQTGFRTVTPVYDTTVGAVADAIQTFGTNHTKSVVDAVGRGLTRALYATYISMIEPKDFSYPVQKHEDLRGWFSEFIRTSDSGQVSVFTANPGITRGGHYHHTKTEKFLVVQGEAVFRFRHVQTGAAHKIRASGATPTVVETAPGWAHDITNVGTTVLVCVLWANEVFDPKRPDTIAYEV